MAKESGEISTEELKTKAKQLGIKFTKNTSDDALLAKIEAAETKKANDVNQHTVDSKHECMALRRVQVAPLNPTEQKLPAKYVCFQNRYVKIAKAVSFNTPIFLEKCIIDVLNSTQYQVIVDNTQILGGKPIKQKPDTYWAPAYQVTELGTPTEEEWKNDPKWKEMRKTKALKDSANGDS